MKKWNKDILVNNTMFNTMSFYTIVISFLPILTLTGCGWGWNNNSVEVKTPKLWQTNISTQEYTKGVYDISNFCKDSTKVILDLSGKTNYSLTDNNTTLTVDLTNIDIPENNRQVNIPLTCINWTKSVNWNITSTEVDTANDIPYTITSSTLPTSIQSGQDYNATIKWTDPDWVPTISYKVLDWNDNNSTLATWYMNCSADSDNQDNSTCTTSISWLADNNNNYYYFTYKVEPVIGWEHPQGDIEGSQKFSVEALNHAPVLNSVSVSWNTIWNIQGNDYYVAQNTDVTVHFQANWSDEDWDNLQIEINWILYNWNSADININLAKNEIKEFHIKEYDGDKYSNEILVRILWI